jgi:hypothetical protein
LLRTPNKVTPSSTRLARVLGLPFQPNEADNIQQGDTVLELTNDALPLQLKGCFYYGIELPVESLVAAICFYCCKKKRDKTYANETYCEVYVGDLVKKGTGLGPWEPAWVVESRPQIGCYRSGAYGLVLDWSVDDPHAVQELKNTKPKMRGKRFQSAVSGNDYVFDEITREPVRLRSYSTRKHSIAAWWFERNKHMEAEYGGGSWRTYIPCLSKAEKTERAWTGGGGCLCCAKKRHYIEHPDQQRMEDERDVEKGMQVVAPGPHPCVKNKVRRRIILASSHTCSPLSSLLRIPLSSLLRIPAHHSVPLL